MNPNLDLENKLNRLAQDFRPPHSVRESVMLHIHFLPIRQQRRSRFIPVSFLRPVMSASLLIFIFLMVGWIAIFNSSSTLYARALDALIQAQSVHASAERKHEDGSWQQGAEVWYHRDFGVIEQSIYQGVTKIRLDDKQFQWRWSSDNRIVIKTQSEDSVGLVEEILDMQKFRTIFPTHPNQESILNGEKIYIYSTIHDSYRIDGWLDSQSRLRRLEEFRKSENNLWELYERTNVEYDIPMDRSRFELRLGSDSVIKDWVKPVDATELLDQAFALDQARFTQEEYGLIFAVHEIRRVDDNLIFLRTSMRPSESLIQEFGPIHSGKKASSLKYGDYQLSSSWKRFPDGSERYYQPWQLAFLTHNGLLAEWSILIPKGNRVENTDSLDLSLYWFARGKLQDRLQKEGKEWHRHHNPLTTLPIPHSSISLNELLDNLYYTGLEFEPAVFQMGFFSASKLIRDPTRGEVDSFQKTVLKPSQLSIERFHEEYRKEYEHLRK